MLPNLLIIGAPKCGTTSLHEYLALHPEVEMSARKELKFFTRRDWREKVAWYEARFATELPVRGESSPTYSMFPFQPSVAERAAELIPESKLIYVVRDPIERAIANYVELYALRLEDRPAAVALTDIEDPANPHICASRYATQLDRFLARFDPSQILVLDHHDLLSHRDETLREVFGFLGVDADFTSPEFEKRHNIRGVKVRYNRLGYWLVKRGIMTEPRTSIRGPLVRPLRRVLSRPIDASLPDESRRLLVDFLSPEVDRLREQTGEPFANWPSFSPSSSQRTGAI